MCQRPKRFYCPNCGTKITKHEWDYVKMMLHHKGITRCLSNPECEEA